VSGTPADVDTATLRRIARTTPDDPSAQTVAALCDVIDGLRMALESAERGEAYWKRADGIVREEFYALRVAITRALGAVK